jgi:hypothetical protein
LKTTTNVLDNAVERLEEVGMDALGKQNDVVISQVGNGNRGVTTDQLLSGSRKGSGARRRSRRKKAALNREEARRKYGRISQT